MSHLNNFIAVTQDTMKLHSFISRIKASDHTDITVGTITATSKPEITEAKYSKQAING